MSSAVSTDTLVQTSKDEQEEALQCTYLTTMYLTATYSTNSKIRNELYCNYYVAVEGALNYPYLSRNNTPDKPTWRSVPPHPCDNVGMHTDYSVRVCPWKPWVHKQEWSKLGTSALSTVYSLYHILITKNPYWGFRTHRSTHARTHAHTHTAAAAAAAAILCSCRAWAAVLCFVRCLYQYMCVYMMTFYIWEWISRITFIQYI